MNDAERISSLTKDKMGAKYTLSDPSQCFVLTSFNRYKLFEIHYPHVYILTFTAMGINDELFIDIFSQTPLIDCSS